MRSRTPSGAGGGGSRRCRPARLVGAAAERRRENAAVSIELMAGKLRSPGRRPSEPTSTPRCGRSAATKPAIDTVEKVSEAAKAAGVPVDLEGPETAGIRTGGLRRPGSAGAVGRRGRSRPAKPVPAVTPLGKAAAKAPRPWRGTRARCPAPARRRRRGAWAAAPVPAPAPLTAEQLLQPPAPDRQAPGR